MKRSLQGEYLGAVSQAFSVEAHKNFRGSHIYKLNNKGHRVQNQDKQMVEHIKNIKLKNQAVELSEEIDKLSLEDIEIKEDITSSRNSVNKIVNIDDENTIPDLRLHRQKSRESIKGSRDGSVSPQRPSD